MSVIGTLAVKITGDNSGLDKSLKKSNSDIAAFAKKSALALTAAAGTFAVFAKKNIDAFDRLAKLSVQAGVTTETLTSLGYAAELSGVSTDQLAMNLGRLSKGMLEAAQGTGEAKKAFDALGIDGGSVKNADEALMQIADRFQQMPDGAQKTALAMQLFGRSGMQMIPFLNQGRDGLEEMRAEAERFGIVLNTQTAKAAEEFNDNLTRIQSVGRGLFFDIANNWLPTIAAMTTSFFEAQKASDSFLKSLLAVAITDLPQTFDEATKAIIEQEIRVNELAEAYRRVEEGTSTMRDRSLIAFGDLELEKSRLAILQKQADLLVKNREGLTNVTAPEFVPMTGKESDSAKKLREELEKAAEEYAKFIGDITGRTDRERKSQQEGWLAYARSIGEITSQEYEDAMEKLRDVKDQMSQFAISAARNIQGVLGDGIYNFLSGKFDDIGQSFLNMLNRMVADLLSSQISQLLFGNFGSTNQIGGIVGQIAGAIGGAIGGGMSGQVASGANALTVNQGMGYGGFAGGGYTGDGYKYDPAGVVHKGEYVLNSAATKRIGIANLDRMNKGYANGGYVGNAPMGGVNINIKNEAGADGYRATAQARQNSDGGLNIDVLVRRVVSSDISNNGALAQQMANTFGLRRAI